MTGRADDADIRELTRRDLLQRAGAAGLTLTAGGLLAACGGGGSSSASTAAGSPATAAAKKGGVLRIGIPSGSAANSLDPNKFFVFPDFLRGFNLYDGFTYANKEFSGPENRLAEEFTSNKAGDVWTLRLKHGIEFHNGKTLSAEDAIFTVQRILDPKQASAGAALLAPFVDGNGLSKMDKRTVRFKLKTPFATLPTLFANWSICWILPVGYDPKKPVGTGPFKYVSFAPGKNSKFVAFDNYWGGRPNVDELQFIDLPDDSARVNALLGGQVEAIASVPFADITSVKSNPNVNLVETETATWYPIRMQCRPGNPFADAKVRQAFRLMADRKQMIEQAYLGHGVVGNDLMTPSDPNFLKVEQRTQDLDKAKALLAAAGVADQKFEFTTANLGAGAVEYCTSFVEQVSRAGINIKLNKVDPSVWAGPKYLKWPIANDYWPGVLGYIEQVALSVAPKAGYNETGFGDQDSEFASLYRQATKEVDEGKRKQLEQEMQRIEYERGAFIIWGFQNIVDATSKKVTGFVTDKSGWNLGSGNMKNVSFT